MRFGESLRAARERRGLTQQQVADMMGLDKSTYCGYETGKRQPDVPKLKKLSSILGVSGDELLETGFEKPTIASDDGLTEKAKSFLAVYSQLDPGIQNKLDELARLYLDDQRRKKENQ